MVRKRLSNLNSEASKKVVKPEAASPVSPPVEPKESVSLPTSVENAVEATSKPEPEAFSVEPLEIDVPHVEVKDEESADRPDSAPDSAQSSSPPAAATLPDTSPNAALEATIAELNATLETVRQTAQHRETELLKQIAQLQAALQAQQTLADQRQSELQTQQALIDQLQTELKQSSQLQAELADAKKMILQLSQVNPQPVQPVPSQIRAAEPELEISSPQLIHPAPAKVRGDDRQPAPIALQRQSAPPVRQTPFVMPSEKKPPEQPVIEQNNKLSDADLGWVD